MKTDLENPTYSDKLLNFAIEWVKERGTKITLDFCSTLKTDKRREQKQLLRNKPELSKN